jgi:hypothetical protein
MLFRACVAGKGYFDVTTVGPATAQQIAQVTNGQHSSLANE